MELYTNNAPMLPPLSHYTEPMRSGENRNKQKQTEIVGSHSVEKLTPYQEH